MQDGYLGNNQDYVKFALLWHIHCKTRLRIGVNWYANSAPLKTTKSTGKPKDPWAFLSKPHEWEFLDPKLFKILCWLNKNPSKRKIECVPKMGIFPEGTRYFKEQITDKDRSDWNDRAKSDWHDRAKTKLGRADLIFLDPDTGFETKKDKKSLNYALYSEAIAWLKAGKHVVIYQAATYEGTVIKQAETVRDELYSRAGICDVKAPVIRGRSDPNVLLVTISPEGKAAELNDALESFVPQICYQKDCKTTDCKHPECKIKLVR